VLANAQQHSPHLAVGYLQPLGCCYLRKVLLLYLVQPFQAVRSRWFKVMRSVSMGPSALQ
jgi:hypothetical protein